MSIFNSLSLSLCLSIITLSFISVSILSLLLCFSYTTFSSRLPHITSFFNLNSILFFFNDLVSTFILHTCTYALSFIFIFPTCSQYSFTSNGGGIYRRSIDGRSATYVSFPKLIYQYLFTCDDYRYSGNLSKSSFLRKWTIIPASVEWNIPYF